MLEIIVDTLKSVFYFLLTWDTNPWLRTLGDERREREHNRRWSKEFLQQKELERAERLKSAARKASPKRWGRP
jgi:hypothetical protein